ncbi:hypothetical protein K505DRAFT_372354 [Melanomma pulvis-pyrius CBS 109.77]|uniref:Protein NO VEIN C-terminal domain-containing protein n=1 Tax=Melanomma pulvis-pyrius CBS 109.77 TaxID=1314802 RepID=A0A6A6XMM3_9PLEO|nr:hypothetical protein K505DRAFT_372354 [Melanomma pulvis-pyrius CBS 109.77]
MKADAEFVRLLDHIMSAAARAQFPSQIMDMSNIRNALPDIGKSPGPFKFLAPTNFVRDCKVGAAGELFVFCLLESVLRGKDKIYTGDWRSNMRNLVKQHHPQFKDWPDWTERETADIVFPDEHGALTYLLIQNGYLDYNLWYNQRPEYLIEVKSSLSDKNKEFYLSSDQYRRMQEYSTPLPSSTQRPKIYMIARVSNLQERDIDMRIYMDPETLRKNNKLRFRQVWAVEEV